ncbi:MAG: penicillin acylase family protein [Caulobacteraceae bacterium]|nr:penicillin acylase family protein [Caulobacteraceae bacterium]
MIRKLAALALGFCALAAPAAAEPAQEARTVAGLAAPAEILVDKWGISHIYAGSVRDAFFLQGYNVARDRLWQIDLWRKRGLGLLARDFGAAYVPQDRAARLFRYRGAMEREWAAYGPDAKGYAEAFVAGINAYVGEIRAGGRPLPEEFAIAGTQPDLWKAEDVVRIRSHGLTRNAAAEVARARVVCLGGLEATRLQRKLEPDWTLKVPEGLDPCDVPEDVLADYGLATQGVRFERTAPLKIAADVPPDAIGSNNWTIAPSRTATGRPILANDPHREHGAPSLRYIVHMEAPGFSAIGAGEPALPGISIGHNGTIAFGLTIFAADQEDLYVYETDPADPLRYRYKGGWEPMRLVLETIPVKGGAAAEVDLAFTRHGPVVKREPGKHRAYALRSVWSEPGTSAYFGSVGYMTARDWKGFTAAMENWGAPSENQVYADASGDIGWIVGSRTPVRPGWDGLFPVPGDGRYEWNGFLKAAELPQSHNPAKGWFATANEMNLPADYPYAERKVGFEWSNDARVRRISEVLAANDKVSLADAMALQTDPINVTARRLQALLEPLASDDADTRAALDLVRGWDGRTAADSAAAAVYEIWIAKHLGRATVARATPAAARAAVGAGDFAAVLELLEVPDASLGADPDGARDAILKDSLKAAFAEVRGKLGPDPARWRWGDLHQARFEHALTPLVDPARRARLSVGPAPMAGTMLSPLAASWRPNDYRVVAGASFRMVLDVGAWDNSRVINTPGQSGDPSSPHFGDLFDKWSRGEYVPLAYSRPAVEAVAERRLRLTPP